MSTFTTYGTNHFISRKAAEEYYMELSYSSKGIQAVVEYKLVSEEIAIGRPYLQPNEFTSIDEDGRYIVRKRA